jgi:DNA sulfur modification protein DndE
LTPLSHFDKPNSSSTTITNNTNVDTTTPVRDQVNNLNGEQFFKKFSAALKKNPPAAADGPIVSQLAQIGIIPGQEFDINKLDPTIVQAINEAPKQGLKAILKGKDTIAKNVNGWDFFSNVGTYGTNYLDRAVIAFLGLGANLSQDAIYPSAMVDSEGQPLVGTNLYRIHFEKDKLPPVKGFWSLTLYGPDFFFVPNDLKRYSISPRDHLVNNEDGSVDLYIQNESPGKDKESNWLPAPKGPFVLMFRFYWPEQQLIDGDWKIPPVQKVK